MNRYSRSISVATEEAVGGNRGNELDIYRLSVAVRTTARACG